jgi:trafficking protein particle complex subunit 6
MSRTSTPQVSEACVDFMNIEFVRYAIESSKSSKEPGKSAAHKLERMGFRVGQKLAERYTRSRPRFTGELDRIKFLCKDFWQIVFKKHIDNLRTNHRGVYVLYDARFRWLLTLSGPGALEHAQDYIHFPRGLIRGCCAALGLSCTVSTDVPALPTCTFTVKITNKTTRA